MSENTVGVAIPEQWVHAASDLKHGHMYTHSRQPKKRKKSHDEIANESCSSGKLSGKGKSVSARNVSVQFASARNVSSQSGGSSQLIAAQSTSTGARNASS
ncbi:hypothetical protein Tco_0964689 [Tanacetum coccineum]